jgi:hypothetical protein
LLDSDVAEERQRPGDSLIHVVVAIVAEATGEPGDDDDEEVEADEAAA